MSSRSSSPSDTVAILARNRRTGQTVQRITSAETVAGPEFQSWLRNENAAGADIFIGMNPLKEGADGRTKDNIQGIRHLYLDLDTGGEDALEAIRNSAEVPAPNFVLDTSPGKYQIVWKVEELDREQAESMMRAMADQFGGDPAATDSTRVLRLPGFANRKYDEEFVVRSSPRIKRDLSRARFHRPGRFARDSPASGRANPDGDCRRDTRANPSRIGPTRNVPSLVATIKKKSSAGSRIFAPRIRPTRVTTLAIPL